MGKKDLEQAAEVIRRNRNFLIACHIRPDGDTLGSALALARTLRHMGKTALVVCSDPVPETYKYLPDSDAVVTAAPVRGFEVAIVPDCDGLARVGDAIDAVNGAGTIVSIDHHSSQEQFGDVRLYNTSAAATAEIALELIEHLGVAMDKETAICLMTGVISDTGAFRFRNVTPNTFTAAAKLTAAGASPSDVARLVYESRSLESTRLLGVALASLKIDETGQIVWTSLAQDDFRRTGTTDAETEGIINHIGAIKTAKVALLFREASDGAIVVSLRSRDAVDVSQIAKTFGGGGHPAAAGCHVSGPMEEAERRVIEEARKWMGL